jgi:flagellar protein FlgJ
MHVVLRTVTLAVAGAVAVAVAAAVALTGPAGAAPARAGKVKLTAKQAAFLSAVVGPARDSQRRYGVPASAVIAQAVLETGWGTSVLARTANNYFGMACAGGRPGPVAAGCQAGVDRFCDRSGCRKSTAEFRVYRSTADSFRDHGRLFSTNPRYARAYANRANANRFVAEMHRAGYATDPRYARSVTRIMAKYHLYRYNRR